MRQEYITRRREGRPLEVMSARELDARRASPANSIAARKAVRREQLRALFRNTCRSRSSERIALDTVRAEVLSRESEQSARLLVALGKAPAAAIGRLCYGHDFTPVGLSPEGRAVLTRRMLAVLPDPANGIDVPEGSRLARKVAAFRNSRAELGPRFVPSGRQSSTGRKTPERAKSMAGTAA